MGLRVGLTGGMGSGKTLAASYFREFGAKVLDADQICRKLVEPGQPALKEISDMFGESVIDDSGRLDRKKLAEIVFNNPDKKKELENILHPRVFESEKEEYLRICEKDPNALVIVDAALLIESGNYKAMDRVIVVNTDEQNQIERVLDRSEWTREEVIARIRNQMPSSEKIKFADFVIENSSDKPHLRQKVKDIYKELSTISGENS